MLEEYSYLIPEESRGVITENVKELRRIEEILRRKFDDHKFCEALIPLFEYVDLYKNVYKDFDEEKVFKYIGKDGKVIALRWDFTIPIARYYFLQNTEKEARYSYFGKVYRKEETYKGKNTETYQAGIELISIPENKGDKECLSIMLECLKELKLKRIKIELGSAKFFNRICDLVPDRITLTEILKKKNISEMEKFIEKNSNINSNLKELLIKLPRLCGDINMLEDVMNEVKDKDLLDAMQGLKEIYNKLGNKGDILFDLGMCPAMEYYTNLMFKAYSLYCSNPIVSGGRYDALYKNFKKEVPAIGVGFYISEMIQALEKEGDM